MEHFGDEADITITFSVIKAANSGKNVIRAHSDDDTDVYILLP